MAFRKVDKPVINYTPPSNDSLRLVTGNTALVTVINAVVPISGITNIGNGPGYVFSSVQNRIAEFRGLSGDTNISINYVQSGDTVGIHLNDNIIVNSISATTFYSGSTPLSQLLTGGTGSFTQLYVSGGTGSESLISILPASDSNLAANNAVVLSKSSSGLSTFSSIFGGKNNLINSTSDYSSAGGYNNIINPSSNFSKIFGKTNRINGTYTNVDGLYNSGYTSFSKISGKQNYSIGNYFGIFQLLYNCYGLNTINGANNHTTNAGVNNIHNGFSNWIFNGNYNSILNGTENRTYNSSLALIQGSSNKTYGVNYSTLIGTNNITTTANTSLVQFNSIVGATQSRIEDSPLSSVWGGQLNKITGITPGLNTILNGDGAKIHGSRSTVINGFNSFILNSSDNCAIISGNDNNILAGKNSIIFNGNLNVVNSSTGVTLINVNNVTTNSSDENLLITNKIRSLYLTGGTTQMVVADVSGNLSTQAIPSGGTGTALFSGTTAGGIKQIYPADNNISNNDYSVVLGKNNKIYNKYSIISNGNYNTINLGSGAYSLIGTGAYNNINSGNFNSIGNGSLNLISGATHYQSVGNGKRNKIYSSYFASINNGSRNYIRSSNHSTVLGGYRNNIINNQHSTILNGSYNTILCTGSTDGNVIINGDHNTIQYSRHSAILAGKYNLLNSTNYSSIISGSYITGSTHNTAFGDKLQLKSLTGATSQMVIASTNGLLSTQAIPSSNSVNNGLNTYTAGTSTFQSVNVSALTINNLTVSASTSLNTLSATTVQVRNLSGGTTRMVVANTSGVLSSQAIPTYTQYWAIGGVASSLVQNNGYTTANSNFSIVAGKNTSIGINSNYSNILGGLSNQNIDNNKYSAIVNGFENNIKDYSNHAFIGSGRGGYIYNSNNSSILNGYGNRIYNSVSNSESKYNTILGGYTNKIIRSFHSIVLGGYLNSIGTGDYLNKYSLVFGKQNYVQADYSAIIGGQGYTLTENNTLMTPKLKIGNLPSTSSTYLLNANSSGNVYKVATSGGTGIQINNSAGLLTITYTGSTTSGGATVNNGLNTYTAGTSTFQSVNVSALTINNLTVSGYTSLNTLSASSVQISNLVSTGNTKMVVADINGNLSANTIPFNILNYRQSTLPSNSAKRYYRNTPILGSIANGTLAANSIVLSPWYCGKDCVVDEMLINVTTTGGTGVFALAVYDNLTPNGLFPGNLKQSYGTGKTSPTGIKALTANTAVNYTTGMYWIAIWNSTSFAVNVTSANGIDIGTTSANFTNAFTFTSAATFSNGVFPSQMSGVTATNTIVPIFNIHMKTIYN